MKLEKPRIVLPQKRKIEKYCAHTSWGAMELRRTKRCVLVMNEFKKCSNDD
jgi:hypothetical protein